MKLQFATLNGARFWLLTPPTGKRTVDCQSAADLLQSTIPEKQAQADSLRYSQALSQKQTTRYSIRIPYWHVTIALIHP